MKIKLIGYVFTMYIVKNVLKIIFANQLHSRSFKNIVHPFA